MELTSKLIEQIAFNTKSKIGEQMLVVMDKSTHEEHLCQPIQTNNKQFKIALSLITVYNGIFNVTNSNNIFFPAKQLLTKKILYKFLYQQVLMN